MLGVDTKVVGSWCCMFCSMLAIVDGLACVRMSVKGVCFVGWTRIVVELREKLFGLNLCESPGKIVEL